MAGNTGKLTTEALEARGPRMRLLSFYLGRRRIGFIVALEGQPATQTKTAVVCRTYASSYTLRYLLKIGVANV